MRIAYLSLLVAVALAGPSVHSARCPWVIEGQVTSNTGEPLAQSQVAVVGTDIAAGTDVNGHYRLRIACERASGQVQLRFRRIGYESTTQLVTLTRDSI